MPSDERVAIRLSLSVRRNHIESVSGQSARRPLAADSNIGKYLRECRSEFRVLLKQETEGGVRILNSAFLVILTPPPQKQSGGECLDTPSPPFCLITSACFAGFRIHAYACFAGSEACMIAGAVKRVIAIS